MYVSKTNPNQSKNNTLMIDNVHSGNCGDGAKIIAARYRAVLVVASQATVDRIVIDGVTYMFAAAYATTTATGRNSILTEIEAVMTKILGVNNGRTIMSVNSGATKIYITTDYSAPKFNYLSDGTTNVPFVPTSVKVLGTKDSTDANFDLTVVHNIGANTYDVWIKPYAGKSISNVTIDYNAGTVEYNGAWTPPSGATFGTGASFDKGAIKITALASAVATVAHTLAVSITPTGGSAIAFSQSIILSDFKGQ